MRRPHFCESSSSRLVAAYPLCDAEDDQLQEALAKLRARFKVRRPPQGGFGGRVT